MRESRALRACFSPSPALRRSCRSFAFSSTPASACTSAKLSRDPTARVNEASRSGRSESRAAS
eukprot:2452887-Rhodomonas_salina.1